MSVRFCSARSRGAAVALAAAGALALQCATALGTGGALGAGTAGVRDSLISIGEGSSPVAGLPSIKVEVPSPTGGAPLVEVGVDEKGVTASTPVLPPVEVPVAKAETPSTPSVPSVPSAPSTPSVPSVPVGGSPVEAVTNPTGGGSGGSGSSGSGGSGASGSSAGTSAASSAGTSASSGAAGVAGTTGSGRSGARSAGAGSATNGKRRGSGGAGGSGAATGAKAAAGGGASGAGAASTRARSGARTGAAARRAEHGTNDPLASLGSSLPVPLPVPDWSKPIILLLALLAIAFGVRWRLATRRAGRLERRQSSLMRDIEAMQAALVPDVPERLGGLAVSVAYRPAEGPAAGGDFYDVFALDSERVAVIVGDVAGHGHDALRHAALTRYTLRAFVKETGEPRAALALAGHALSEPGYEQLATVAIAVFDSARGTLTHALAGHPPPIVLGVAAGDAPASCSSPPVGCELPTGRRQRTLSLPEGARACFFSDGLIEARLGTRAPDGHPEMLGRARLRELLTELPAGAGASELLAAVRADAASTPDDMAACIVTCELHGARRPIDVEELEVDARVLAGGHLESYLRGSGLTGEQAARVLAATRAQLDAHDTAVLVVDRAGGEADFAVRAGEDRHGAAGGRRRAEPGPVRLLRA